MNRLKSKGTSGRDHTSQFFKNIPSQDEKAANVATSQEADSDAGIKRSLRKKHSLFFRKQSDKPLPAPPSATNSPNEASPSVPKEVIGVNNTPKTTTSEIGKPLPWHPVSAEIATSAAQTIADEESSKAARKAKPVDLVIKKRPSFASLRKSSSRIFRSKIGDHVPPPPPPPPPPVPQIPVDTPTPKLRRRTLRHLEPARSTRSPQSNSGHILSISQPVSSTQISQLPSTFNSAKVPFTKPAVPPPPVPPRPESLDKELQALTRDGSARMILHTPNRARTLTASTSSSARSRVLTRVGSEEAYTRLGFQSGHSFLSSPRSPTLDSPLAAKFPLDPNRPLPFRDSSGSVKGYERFSAYIKARQQCSSGGYDDGIERDDRELGSIEMYRESKCGDWTLERRVSGKLGERGMLFRDRWGGWHFVADI